MVDDASACVFFAPFAPSRPFYDVACIRTSTAMRSSRSVHGSSAAAGSLFSADGEKKLLVR